MRKVSLALYYFVLYDGALTLKMSKWRLTRFAIKTLHIISGPRCWQVTFNPILTGLFESKFLLGGVNLTPPSDLGPEGADRREILHGCEDTSQEYCYGKKNAENGLFIILL